MTNITSKTSAGYVLIARNENNTEFYLRTRSDFEREMETGAGGFIINTSDGVRTEKEVVNMIVDGKKCYTYSAVDKTFTAVTVVDENIKSVKNKTTLDNIASLPLLS